MRASLSWKDIGEAETNRTKCTGEESLGVFNNGGFLAPQSYEATTELPGATDR